MSLQERKPKNRISQNLESQDVSKEVKVKRMVYKSPVPRRLSSSNRASTEQQQPKIMMKRIRSIKLLKIYSLKRRGASQLDRMSSDSSDNDSSSSHSTPDKKIYQAKSESEEESYSSSSSGNMTLSPNQVGGVNSGKDRKRGSKSKHSCPSCFRPFGKDTKPILVNSLQQSLEEGSDALPDYAKPNRGLKKQVQSPSYTSDSSIFSTDSSEPRMTGLHSSKSESAALSRKSLQTMTKSSSTRTVGNLRKKTSFKIKSSSGGKPAKVMQDLGLNRATCSSTLKDSKFPKQVELKPGQSESDIVSAKKVCPYHHCSLHGHSHAPEPPPKRFSFRRRSERSPKSVEPKGLSSDAVTSFGGKKKAVQTRKTFSSIEPASAKSSGSTGSPRVKYHKNVDRTITKSRTESYTGASQKKENATSECFSTKIKQDKSTSEAKHTQPNGEEVHASSAGIEISSTTMTGITEDELSTSKDSAEATKHCEELSASRKEIIGTSYPGVELVNDSVLRRDGEPTEENNSSPAIDKASNIQIKKNSHVSMWQMIHQQMLLGLAENAENQQLHPRSEERQDNDAKTLNETYDSHLSAEISNSEMVAENQSQESKALELRKIFAIKLVREAIEKILLPEVEDQTSDTISITSEIVSDEEHPEQNHDRREDQSITTTNQISEHHLREMENNELGGVISVDAKKSSHPKVAISVPGEVKTSKKSEKKALKGWSNLRKIVLLKRFVTELEKVKKFNPVQPRHLASEPTSEAEKISLRRQMMGEKKSAEEWMLDYALRQVVSELAPTQKRKVALLVKAFETVVPPNEEQNIQVTTPKLRIPADPKDKEIQSNLYLNSDLQSEGPEFSGAEMDLPRSVARKTSFTVYSSSAEGDNKENQAEIVHPALDTAPQEEVTADTEETIGQSRLEHEALPEIPLLTASSPVSVANEEQKTQLYKQNVKMWHMIYRHVVSGIAEKVGTQLLDVDGEDEEEIDDGNKLPGNSSSSVETDHYDRKENHDTNHQNIEFSRSDAVKLVQEAVDEILLPDIQDDSSDSKSVASDTLPDQELINKLQGADEVPSIKNSKESAEDSFRDSFKNTKDTAVSLDQEIKASPVGDINTRDNERAASLIKTNLLQQKSKNWSKLKKLILLKRSIKALEDVRKLNPKPSQQIPLTSDPEEEKINLKQQMMDERKKAEQWMLDYAVQHIVTKLTPARKRRVAMLVEAFEAVVPLPQV
ncbi:hypothetical protein POM88_014769 [Heracleum sosnowskyi]|uniref:Calmodulin-binding domain-containing protein n=1 Tax=Heracleum sosnowskyi TaxID=360622 RepID=A0AAD8IKH9_9APIA|nr:hypothetical protein POM88_014769 [Heracleum sosnowskyi]